MDSKRPRLALAMTLGSLIGAWGVTAVAAPRPTVVELFTSQGCSSCPPADALLGELSHRSNVLALAFHVEYWDGLGWKDRFGLPYASVRQSNYTRALNLSSAFTPQAVIDGQRSFVGSDRGRLLPAIAGATEGVAIAIERHDDGFTIELGAAPGRESADVLFLALLPEAQTAISRGENGGRTLRDYNVVRATRALGSWHGDAERFTVPRSSIPPDATAAAVLIQQSGQGSILGAAQIAWR